jgi:general secretion pathway protein D
VTPRISANSNIALKVIPEVSNKDGTDTQVSNGQNNTANIYAIRKVETQVVIPNGHTLVMGGLISDTTQRARTKVPILGDLPGVGMAFRSDSKQRTKQNLIMFITPTIVEDQDFQPSQTAFLKNKAVDKVEPVENAWDSAKPYDWKKKN